MTQFRQDRMTSKERFEALLKREPVDRVAFYPLAWGFASLNVGYSICDVYYDMQKAYNAFKWTNEQYNFLEFPIGGYPAFGPWELGGEIRWPDGEFTQCPMTARLPVETEDDVWNLKIPDDLATRGYMPRYLEFGKLAEKDGLRYHLALYGPWTTAGNIVDLAQLCKWVIKKPDLAHHVLRLATDLLLAAYRLFVDTFGTKRLIASVATASVANNIISPKQFKQFAVPYIKEYHEKLLAMGFKHIYLHICGEQNENYPYYLQIPVGDPGIISVSHEVDLEKAIEYFSNDIILGNLEPAVIQTGTPQQVYELARITIEKGRKAPGGFILAPGCELPPKTPPYNVWTIMKAVNDFGWYE